MQKPKSDFEREMVYLDVEIRRLEAEFNMFFAGRLPRPPWETRAKVAALIKKHDRSFIQNTADRFRFESLQNRHQKFIELWERQMMNRELGRPTIGAKRAAPPEAASQTKVAESPGPSLIRFTRDQELTADSERVKELFEKLAEAKRQVGDPPVAIDRLAALVRAQVEKFSAEGRDVAFTVALKDGKVSLTVKPVEN